MSTGYVRVWAPGHPMAKADGYALEHRKVVHDAGIELPAGSHVHHINEDRADNRLENLSVKMPRDHVLDHIVDRGGFVENKTGRWKLRTERPCERCGKPFLPWTQHGRFCSRDCSNRRHL